MLACAAIVLGWLTIYVPPGFMPVPWEQDQSAKAMGTERTRLVSDSGPVSIDVTVFDGPPPTPGGPMGAADAERVAVNGESLGVYWTSMFMGEKDTVAVAYPRQPDGDGTAILVVRGLEFAEALGVVPTVLEGCL